jgi:ComF family protein
MLRETRNSAAQSPRRAPRIKPAGIRTRSGILDLLTALLYPPSCPLCGRYRREPIDPRLCRTCVHQLGRLSEPCLRCAEPASAPLCARCVIRPPPFARARACYVYREGTVGAEAVRRWKYSGDLRLGSALARHFAEAGPWRSACYDLVVPVPLHRSRLRSRGFDQAAILAAAAAGAGRAGRLARGLVVRLQAGKSQASLGRTSRERNVQAAFLVTDRRRVAGASVLLVDDVLTTGATMAACATALLAASASCVEVAALARTARGAAPRDTSSLRG